MVLFAGYENRQPDFRYQDDVPDLDVRLKILTLDCLMPEPRVYLSRLNAPSCWVLVFHERESDQLLDT